MEFLRQEYWSSSPFPSPGDVPDPGIEPASPALQAVSLPLSHLGIHTSEKNNHVGGNLKASQFLSLQPPKTERDGGIMKFQVFMHEEEF